GTPTPTGTLVLNTSDTSGVRAARAVTLPTGARFFRFTGRDPHDTKFFLALLAIQPQLQVPNIPTSVVTVQVDVLSQQTGPTLASFVTPASFTGGATVTLTDPPYVDESDPLQRRFAFLGCNRVNKEQKEDYASTANEQQLLQDLREFPLHSPPPRYFFFTGDIVLNLEDDPNTLQQQLYHWHNAMDRAVQDSGTQMVAIAGNHEMLTQRKTNHTKVEIPNPPTGAVFMSEMAQYIPSSDGPTMDSPNLDELQRDESRLSFTFQSDALFFICVNTETYKGGETSGDTGLVPLAWLEQKLEAAQADVSVQHIFVLGHKPVGSAKDGDDDLQNTINPLQALLFYRALAQTPKVRGYLTAHAHMWEWGVPPNAPPGSTLPQVIAGNGGSETNSLFQPPHSYFGYSLAGVTQGGSVVIESWGRPVPDPYSANTTQPASTLRARFTLYDAP
ncbi:MAG: hypothetical protein FJX76_28835, partial [Armatimonadetes bacterium]|nr:hypothetical protein [Armatimonadota bacterium]